MPAVDMDASDDTEAAGEAADDRDVAVAVAGLLDCSRL